MTLSRQNAATALRSVPVSGARGAFPAWGEASMNEFVTHMRILKRSEATIQKRVELLERLHRWFGRPLLEATTDDLRGFQSTYAHLAPASVDIYTRHVKAFYRWARERDLIGTDPAAPLGVPHVGRGKPHPTRAEDLAVIFACTTGALRTAYILAAFAGLRCGEVCRLQGQDLDFAAPATALVHGKGRKDRTVPLLPAVVDELLRQRRGWVITLDNGKPYTPNRLSVDSSHHLHELGIPTTLHSMRAAFATLAFAATRDPLFVRDLLGHESVATTEIYTLSSLADAHTRLAGLSDQAAGLLHPRRLSAVQ